MRDEDLQRTSCSMTRLLRTQTKGYNTIPTRDPRLLHCPELIGRKLKVMVPGEFVSVGKTVTIKELFPYMALATYKAGPENEHDIKIGLSIADLVEKHVLTYKNGYPEVI